MRSSLSLDPADPDPEKLHKIADTANRNKSIILSTPYKTAQ